jgi:hypothetical protein
MLMVRVIAIYFQEVGDTSMSGVSTHQVAFDIERQLRLCACFVLSPMRQGGYNQLFPSIYIKMGRYLVNQCMIVYEHTSELEPGSRK